MDYVDQFYQDLNGGVHWLSAQDHANAVSQCLPLPDPTWTLISAEQARDLTAPLPLTGNAAILAQITALEVTVTDRRLREAVLGTDNGWLKSLNEQIAALRSKLT